MGESTCIVLDPTAHFHATGRAWQSCQRACMRALAPMEVAIARGVDEAAEAARDGAMRGFEKIVSVGGAATAHGVLNGVMSLADGHRKALKIGFLSVTRPDPWCRTLDMPRRLEPQLEILQAGNTLPFDVGRIDCLDFQGRPLSRYFLNGAAFGIASRLKYEWGAGTGDVFARIGALAGTLFETVSRREPWVRLEGPDEEIFRGPWIAGLIMVGRYYPGLGHVAPDADPADGLLDLVGAPGPLRISHLAALAGFGFHRGAAHQKRSRREHFRVTGVTAPVYVEADGLALGTLPATFRAVPRALAVMVPKVSVRVIKPRFKRLPELKRGGLAAGNLQVGSGR